MKKYTVLATMAAMLFVAGSAAMAGVTVTGNTGDDYAIVGGSSTYRSFGVHNFSNATVNQKTVNEANSGGDMIMCQDDMSNVNLTSGEVSATTVVDTDVNSMDVVVTDTDVATDEADVTVTNNDGDDSMIGAVASVDDEEVVTNMNNTTLNQDDYIAANTGGRFVAAGEDMDGVTATNGASSTHLDRINYVNSFTFTRTR